jgi:hypothetical protein
MLSFGKFITKGHSSPSAEPSAMRYQPGPFRTDDLLIAAVSAVLAWTITLALRTLFAGWTIRVLDTRPAQQRQARLQHSVSSARTSEWIMAMAAKRPERGSLTPVHKSGEDDNRYNGEGGPNPRQVFAFPRSHFNDLFSNFRGFSCSLRTYSGVGAVGLTTSALWH